jgi:hypothetical protein
MNQRPRIQKAPKASHGGRQAVPGLLEENAQILRAEVGRCAVRINEHVGRLSAVGSQAFYSTGGLSRDATADELRRLSADLRGVVCHAQALLGEIQSEVGRLDVLATFRELEVAVE